LSGRSRIPTICVFATFPVREFFRLDSGTSALFDYCPDKKRQFGRPHGIVLGYKRLGPGLCPQIATTEHLFVLISAQASTRRALRATAPDASSDNRNLPPSDLLKWVNHDLSSCSTGPSFYSILGVLVEGADLWADELPCDGSQVPPSLGL